MTDLLRSTLRWSLRLGAFAILAVAAAYAARDTLARTWIRHRIAAVSGLDTRLDRARLDLRTPSVLLEGLHILNHPEFGAGPLLDAPSIRIEWDRDALARREIRLRQATLHVAHASAVRSAAGQTNLIALRDHAADNASLLDLAVIAPPGFAWAGIDHLSLTFGTLDLVDLKPPGFNRSIQVALTNEVLRNVREPQDLSPLVTRIIIREISAGLSDALRPRPRSQPTPPSTPPRP